MEFASPPLLSKAASAYEHLRGLAVRGELRPARRLSPPDLAQVLRVSVTPVRDALARLAAEGLVVSASGRGYFSRRAEFDDQLGLERLLTLGLLAAVHPDLGGRPSEASPLEPLAEVFGAAGETPQDGWRCAEAAGWIFTRPASASGDPVLFTTLSNAADRSAWVRAARLQAASAREAELGFLADLLASATAGDLGLASRAIAARAAELRARLPDAVQAANQAAAALKFP